MSVTGTGKQVHQMFYLPNTREQTENISDQLVSVAGHLAAEVPDISPELVEKRTKICCIYGSFALSPRGQKVQVKNCLYTEMLILCIVKLII